MPESVPTNVTLSEDQPIETGAPVNATDVGAEFEAMVNHEPPVDRVDEPLDAPQDVVEEPLQDAVEEPAAEPLAPQEDASVVAQLQAQMAVMQAELEAARSGVKEPTIGEITSQFNAASVVNEEEVFAQRQFLGIAPGTTPEIEFEQALSSPQAFNAALNRVRQSTIRDVLMMLPAISNAHLNHRLAEAEADTAFWSANGDLKEHEQVVRAVASHMLQQNPNMSKGAFYKALENTVRTHLKKPRAATKSGGTQHLPQRGAPQGGQRRPQPTLAGGTSSRRTATPKSGFDAEFDAMRRATS